MRLNYLLLASALLGICYPLLIGGCGSPDKPDEEGSLASISGINTVSWMGDGAAVLGDIPLNQTAIPASHDTGSYGIDATVTGWGPSDLAADVKSDNVTFFQAGQYLGIIGVWAKTQDRNASQMLDDGIRYFDLRVCVNDKGELSTCHSLYGAPLADILNSVRAFTDARPNEIVILAFNHFWDEDPSIGPGVDNLTDAHWTDLANLIKTTLGDRLVDSTLYKPTSTFNQLWAGTKTSTGAATKNRVIAILDRSLDSSIKVADPQIWHQAGAASWVSKTDMNEFYSSTQEKVASPSTDKFHEIRTCVTPDNKMIGRSFLLGGPFPNTVAALADQTNPVVLNWIKNQFSSPGRKNINLIWSDGYERSDMVKLTLYLNQLIPANSTFSFDPLPSSPAWSRWNCPTNFRDDGLYCAKPSAYGVGAGYPWKFGDALNLNGAKKRCAADNPQGCEQNGLIIYPKCQSGFHKFGCCICTPDCPTGMTDIGVSCKK